MRFGRGDPADEDYVEPDEMGGFDYIIDEEENVCWRFSDLPAEMRHAAHREFAKGAGFWVNVYMQWNQDLKRPKQ